MKKFFIVMSLFLCCLVSNTYAQNYGNQWENTGIGIGVSHTNIDGWEDECIDVWVMCCNTYLDASFGHDLKDYSEKIDINTSTVNVGYLFPVGTPTYSTFNLSVGPVIGATMVGDSELNESYFNYGFVVGAKYDMFQFTGKVTKNQVGIGVGLCF